MDTITMLEIQNAVACGEYACLQQCCENRQLETIYRLFSRLSISDMPTLEKLLCGCAVRGLTTPGSPNKIVPHPESNCSDLIINYWREHRTQLTVIKKLIDAQIVLTPWVSGALLPLRSLVTDLENAVDGGYSLTDDVIDRVCFAYVWAQNVIDEANEFMPQALQNIMEWVVGNMPPLGQCCDARPSGQHNWPKISVPNGMIEDVPVGGASSGGSGSGSTPVSAPAPKRKGASAGGSGGGPVAPGGKDTETPEVTFVPAIDKNNNYRESGRK